MCRLFKFCFLIILILAIMGCSDSQDSESTQEKPVIDQIESMNTQMSKQDKLLIYMEIEKAEELLLETWQPFKSQMESDTRITLDDLISQNPIMHQQYLKGVYNIILQGEGSDSVKLNRSNFVPLVSDEEVEIINIELEEIPDGVVEYFLKITEYGEFRDRDPIHGGKRESIYYVDENGKIKLFIANGGLSLIYASPNEESEW